MLDRLNEDFRFFQQSLAARAAPGSAVLEHRQRRHAELQGARFRFQGGDAERHGRLKRLPDTSLTLTSARHIPAKAVSEGPTQMLYRLPYQPSMDGNTVDMDIERVQFADNTLHYQSTMQLLSGRIRTMMAAIQD